MNEFEDFPMRRESTADQIAKGLEGMILRGQLPPGQPIKESPLAEKLGVSRNTVREAVRILGQSGLVRHEMHRGAIVREPNIGELRDLYEIRLMLEPAGIERVEIPEGLPPLRDAIAELRDAVASENTDRIVAKDMAFHAAIVTCLGNGRLDVFFRELTNQLRFYVAVLSLSDLAENRPEGVLDDHVEILSALEAGDRVKARQLLVDHIAGNADRATALLGRAADPAAVGPGL